MKKKWAMVLLLTSLMSACTNVAGGTKENTIREAELSDREQAILTTTSERSLVYDFNMDISKKVAHVRIEKYEFGNLVEEDFVHTSTEIEETGSIVVTNTNSMADQNQILLNVGIASNDSTGALKTYDEINNEMAGASIHENAAADGIDYSEGEVIIGSFAYSWDESGMSSIPQSFYEDPEANVQEIEEYELLYLIKASFTEELDD